MVDKQQYKILRYLLSLILIVSNFFNISALATGSFQEKSSAIEMKSLNYGIDWQSMEVVNFVNRVRIREGLHPLAMHTSLTTGAQIRATELVFLRTHDRPDGRSWETVLPEAGVSNAMFWGENIAWGQSTPRGVMFGPEWNWMDSIGHRENILRGHFNFIGVGFNFDTASRYRYHWAQLFMSGPQINGITVVDEGRSIDVGGRIEDTGARIVMNTADGSYAFIPILTEMVSGLDSNFPGVQVATVHYREFTASFEVSVGSHAHEIVAEPEPAFEPIAEPDPALETIAFPEPALEPIAEPEPVEPQMPEESPSIEPPSIEPPTVSPETTAPALVATAPLPETTAPLPETAAPLLETTAPPPETAAPFIEVTEYLEATVTPELTAAPVEPIELPIITGPLEPIESLEPEAPPATAIPEVTTPQEWTDPTEATISAPNLDLAATIDTLNISIAEVNRLEAQSFTPESWAVLEIFLTEAIKALNSDDINFIQEVTSSLWDAIASLEPSMLAIPNEAIDPLETAFDEIVAPQYLDIVVAIDELEAVIIEATNFRIDDLTPESSAALEFAIAEAMIALDGNDIEYITEVTILLQKVIKSLELCQSTQLVMPTNAPLETAAPMVSITAPAEIVRAQPPLTSTSSVPTLPQTGVAPSSLFLGGLIISGSGLVIAFKMKDE